jgi:hypothetical protein
MNYFLRVPFMVSACLLFGFAVFAQTKYEEGYYINNEGMRINCLIKNMDWGNNPTSFEYKKDKSDKHHQVLTINEVKEFGIVNYSKYIRAVVAIDESPGDEDLDALSDNSEPQWQTDTLFLKVVLAGEATLYSYQGKTPMRFFYQINDSSIQQLVYKPYRPAGTVFYNEEFHGQLLQNINCSNSTYKNIMSIKYQNDDLKNYFIGYNHCKGKDILDPIITRAKEKSFFISILLGIDNTSLSDGFDAQYPGDPNTNSLSFAQKNTFTGGIAAECILPFNNRKWVLPLEITYHSYAAHASSPASGYNTYNLNEGDIKYNTINFASGVRYYLFLNSKASIFINGIVFYNAFVSGDYTSNVINASLGSMLNFAGGVGYRYSKAAVELRYSAPENTFPGYLAFGSSLKRISLILKYELF